MCLSASHSERQLLDVSDGGELLHAGQDSFDSPLGGEGHPPLVFQHEDVSESQRTDHQVFRGRAQQLHQQLQHLVPDGGQTNTTVNTV